jgi:hypothetical protein
MRERKTKVLFSFCRGDRSSDIQKKRLLMLGNPHSMTIVLNNQEAERLTSDLAMPPPATLLPLLLSLNRCRF